MKLTTIEIINDWRSVGLYVDGAENDAEAIAMAREVVGVSVEASTATCGRDWGSRGRRYVELQIENLRTQS